MHVLAIGLTDFLPELMMWALGLLVSVLALILVSLLLFRWSNWNSAASTPPGPKPLPLVGNLHLLFSGPAPHKLFMQLASKYGPVFSLWFGATPVVVASSKEAAREFLKAKDLIFASRPQSLAGKLLFYNHQDLAFAPYGERWRLLRKLCTLELFTSRRIDSFKSIRNEEMAAFLHRINDSAGKVLDLRAVISTLVFNFICRVLMGRRYYGEENGGRTEAAEFTDAMDQLIVLVGAFSIGEYLPWLRWLDLDHVERRLKKVASQLDAILERIIQEHEQNKTEGVNDFIDILLKARDDGEPTMQARTSIKALLTNLFAAGTDTSSVTLEWALAELIKHPRCMSKLQDEICTVVGRERIVEDTDVVGLPYLQAVVKEAFRLHSPAPLMIPHFSNESCKVMGYDIAKGTMLLLNVYAIGRDPAVWEEPDKFKPERFIGNKVDFRGQDFELLPFGAGRRMCPGISLSLPLLYTALANMVHVFDWKMPPGKEVDTVSEAYGLTMVLGSKLEAVPTRTQLALCL